MRTAHGQSMVLFVVATAACTGGMTLDEYHEALVGLEAQRSICHGIAPAYAAAWSACAIDLQDLIDRENREVAAGHATFNASQAAKCVDALKLVLDPKYCWGPTVGIDAEPPDAVSAASLLGDSPLLPGMPQACDDVLTGRVSVGGSCDDGRDCLPGLCGLDSKCIPAPGPGAPCYHSRCGSGLGCESIALDVDKCVPVHGLGEPCGPDAACLYILRCVSGSCARRAGLGEPCTNNVNLCASGLYCAADSTCQSRYDGACASDDDCPGHQICIRSKGLQMLGTCGAPQDVGGPCFPSASGLASGCYKPLFCDASKCARLPGPGQPCLRLTCDPDSYCDNAVCRRRAGQGEPCSSTEQCQNPFFCMPATCPDSSDARCPAFKCKALDQEPRICF